ncbi:hypothetical protein MY4038_000823 [Beauveria bassiana]
MPKSSSAAVTKAKSDRGSKFLTAPETTRPLASFMGKKLASRRTPEYKKAPRHNTRKEKKMVTGRLFRRGEARGCLGVVVVGAPLHGRGVIGLEQSPRLVS